MIKADSWIVLNPFSLPGPIFGWRIARSRADSLDLFINHHVPFPEAAVDDKTLKQHGGGGSRHRRALTLLALLGLLIVQAGCGDDIVLVERPVFDPPPDATFNFLGYYDTEDKITTCGNCHVGKQSGWETAGHAKCAGESASQRWCSILLRGMPHGK